MGFVRCRKFDLWDNNPLIRVLRIYNTDKPLIHHGAFYIGYMIFLDKRRKKRLTPRIGRFLL